MINHYDSKYLLDTCCYILAEFEGRDKMMAVALCVLIGLVILVLRVYLENKNKE